MKTIQSVLIYVICGCGLFASTVKQDIPQEQQHYLQIYLSIQEAQKNENAGQKATARKQYKIALDRLLKFQAENQNWEPKIVEYRVNYCTEKIEALKGAVDANPVACKLPKFQTIWVIIGGVGVIIGVVVGFIIRGRCRENT